MLAPAAQLVAQPAHERTEATDDDLVLEVDALSKDPELLSDLEGQLSVSPLHRHGRELGERWQGGRTDPHLVGVRTSAKTPYGSAASAWRTGSANAAVFPLPVCALPTTSRPANPPRPTGPAGKRVHGLGRA